MDKTPIPSNSSSTIQFVREEKFAVSTNPTALTEGVAPDAVGITLSEFQATAEQYGYLVILSDLAELTADFLFGGIFSKYQGTANYAFA